MSIEAPDGDYVRLEDGTILLCDTDEEGCAIPGTFNLWDPGLLAEERVDISFPQNKLTAADKKYIATQLVKRNMEHPCCSACDSPVDVNFMRLEPLEKAEAEGKHFQYLNSWAMCLPCYVHNYHSEVDQAIIDRQAVLGEKAGYYK
jgi:hypothetical protein